MQLSDEDRYDRLSERVTRLEENAKAYVQTLNEVNLTLKTVRDEMNRYKGMAGGVLWIASGLVVMLTLLKDYIFSKL